MAIVNAEVRFAPKLTAWFTANPTKVLQDGEIVYCSDGANVGKYVIGDNSTQLSALTFYGGISSSGLTIGTTTITSGTNTRIFYNNNGVLGEYAVTGTGTTAVLSTSPTFTTDITTPLINGSSGALSFTNTATATGALTNFTFTVAAHTNQTLSTNIPNFKVTGATIQYATGVKALQYFNWFTSNTTSAVGASSFTEVGNLVVDYVQGGTNATNVLSAAIYIPGFVGLTNTTNSFGIYVNSASGAIKNFSIGTSGDIVLGGSNLWVGVAPSSTSSTNFAITSSGSTNRFNASGTSVLSVGNAAKVSASAETIIFTSSNASSSAYTNFTFTASTNTNQTLNTNIPNFKVTGSTKQKATGADALQYYNWFTSNTSSYVGASTLTLGANSVFEYMQGGTNATITTSAAIYVPTLALTNTTTSYGIYVNAASGASTNYALGSLGAVQFTNNTTQLDDFVGAVTGAKRFRVWNTTSSTTSFVQLDAQNNGGALSSMGVNSGAYTGAGLYIANTHFFIAQNGSSGANVLYGANNAAMNIKFINGGTATTDEAFGITSTKNVTIGNAALATTATDGFLYVTSCAGVPTGVPTAITGRIPIVADSTNNKLYIYSGGAWVALN